MKDGMNKTKNNLSETPKVIISSSVRDYGNDPYFIKKADESKIFLEKHGFPKGLPKRSDQK